LGIHCCGEPIPGRGVLCKFLAHNICVVIQSQCELGIEPVFWHDEPGEMDGPRDILRLWRPG
jgi:hypothetical protein